jgi:hypothetical protein
MHAIALILSQRQRPVQKRCMKRPKKPPNQLWLSCCFKRKKKDFIFDIFTNELKKTHQITLMGLSS